MSLIVVDLFDPFQTLGTRSKHWGPLANIELTWIRSSIGIARVSELVPY